MGNTGVLDELLSRLKARCRDIENTNPDEYGWGVVDGLQDAAGLVEELKDELAKEVT